MLITGENNETLQNIYCILLKFTQFIDSQSPKHFGEKCDY